MPTQNSSPHLRRALLIGCHGGVGRAVLALLAHTAPGRGLRKCLDGVVLADSRAAVDPVPLTGACLLPPSPVASADDLMRIVREQRITEVIDLSSIDTADCATACDDSATHFLCTSVEEWSGHDSLATDEAIARLLPPSVRS